MSPISDNWPDIEASLEIMEPENATRITSMVDQLIPHRTKIESFASSLHPHRLPCRLLDHYTWGQSFLVYELRFEDESWIIRFGMRPMDAYFNTAEQLERKILNEVAALHLVRQRTTIPVPTIIAYHPHPSPTNPLGPEFPAFVLMTAITGMTIEDCGVAIHELGSGSSISAVDVGSDPLRGDESKRPILQRYLHDIADIHVQLSRITFDKIGSFVIDDQGEVSVGPGADFGLGPFSSAQEYFAIQAEAYERLAMAAGLDDEAEEGESAEPAQLKRRFVASLWRRAMMPLVDERDDRGPFPMRHGDLHSDNILVDETGHIVGVLDWDCAGTVPWEAFAVPTFEVSGHFTEADTASISSVSTDESSYPSTVRPVVHHVFNRELAEVESQDEEMAFKPASGRSLAALHDSDAGHVGAYLAYWMYSLACDYDQTGRALHRMLGTDDDMDDAFQNFVKDLDATETSSADDNTGVVIVA